MKRISFLILFFAVLPYVAQAQTKQQQAIVKTHGRLQDDGSVKAGRPIPDALVEIKGGTKIFSDEQGELAFGVSASNEYSFTNISKEGYTLSDWDIIAHTLQYSETPKDILLEDIEEQKNERMAIINKVRRKYYAKLGILQDSINNLHLLVDASDEEIIKLQTRLDSLYENAEQCVNKMVNEHLAIDFDRSDDFDRKISTYILNGELDRADSMLATKGDIEKGVKQSLKLQKVAEQDKEEKSKMCYYKYQIAFHRLQYDSAAHYLELRAELDCHNIDWQLEAGEFIREVLANYERALAVYQPALEYSLKHFGELHEKTAELYNNIGLVYSYQGNYSFALECYNRSLVILEKVQGTEHPNTATLYSNIGDIYSDQGNYSFALEYYVKSLAIRENVLGLHLDVADSYDDMGSVYSYQGNYSLALEQYAKSLAIREKVLGTEHLYVALSYNNLHNVYMDMGNNTLALEYLNKAINIYRIVYEGIPEFSKELSYLIGALDLLKLVLEHLPQN